MRFFYFFVLFFLSTIAFAQDKNQTPSSAKEETEAVEAELWGNTAYQPKKSKWILADPKSDPFASPEWFAFMEGRFFFWQSKMSGSFLSSLGTIKGTSVDEDQLQINREKYLLSGELRIGPAPLHARISYLEGEYGGRGNAPSTFFFQGLQIPQGNFFKSKVDFQDVFVDINAAGLYSNGPDGPSATSRFYFGTGYLRMGQEVDGIALGKVDKSIEAWTWHFGFHGSFSPFSFLSIFGDANGGGYKSNGLEIASLTIIRLRAGLQFNLTRFIHLGVEYRYHYYRLNKSGTISRIEIYGPSFFGEASF